MKEVSYVLCIIDELHDPVIRMITQLNYSPVIAMGRDVLI